MSSKSEDIIFNSFNSNGCVKFETLDDKLIGVMGLYKFGDLYEAGSLCVWEEFRGQGYGYLIQKMLLEIYSDLNIFLVTNVNTVQKNSSNGGLIEMSLDNINKSVLGIIEEGGKLLSDDKVYHNKTLFVNEKFYNLNNQNENN